MKELNESENRQSSLSGVELGPGLVVFALLTLIAVLLGLVHWMSEDAESTSTPAASDGLEDAGTAPKLVAIIVLDGVQSDHLSPYGYILDTTPNLELLAQRSLIFSRHYPSSTSANGSMASLLSGLHVRDHGVGSLRPRGQARLPLEVTTLAEVLDAAGYWTAAALSLPQLDAELSGLDQGFDFYDAPTLSWGGTYRSAAETLEQLQRATQQRLATKESVFVVLHLADALEPWDAPSDHRARFIDDHMEPHEDELGEELDRLRADPAAGLAELKSKVLRRRSSTAKHDLQSALYDGQLAYMDAQLGPFLELCASTRRESLVVVVGNRGPRWGGDSAPLGPPIATPLLIAAGSGEGLVLELCSTTDLFRTVLSWVGSGAVQGDGHDLLQEGAGATRTAVICEDGASQVALTSDSWASIADQWSTKDAGLRVVSAGVGLPEVQHRSELGVAQGEALQALHDYLPQEERTILSFRPPLPVAAGERVTVRASRLGRGGVRLLPSGSTERGNAQGRGSFEQVGLPGALQELTVSSIERALDLRLAFGFPEGLEVEDHVLIGDAPLSEVPLLRVQGDIAYPWPRDAEDLLEPAIVAIDHLQNLTYRLTVMATAQQEVEVLLNLQWPLTSAYSTRLEVAQASEPSVVEIGELEGRHDIAHLSSRGTLTVDFQKPKKARLALSVAIDGRQVPVSGFRFKDRRFCGQNELYLYIPAWQKGVSEILCAAPDDSEVPPGCIIIRRRGSGMRAEWMSGLTPEQEGFVRRLGKRE